MVDLANQGTISFPFKRQQSNQHFLHTVMCDFCVFEKIALPRLNVWSYGVIVAAAHSFFLPLSVDFCRTFKEGCSIWKSLGLLPHGNILQADLGVAHQRQTTERNLMMGSSPLCRVKTLADLGVIRVHCECAEDTMKEPLMTTVTQ